MIILTELYNGDSNPLHFLVSRMPNALIHCHHYCNWPGRCRFHPRKLGWVQWMVNQTSNKIKINHFDPKSCPNPRLIHFCPKSYPNPGFLLPKRHIFGSEFEKFSFLSLFWTFFDPLKQVYQTWSDIIWGPNREMGTSVQIVISRSRLRNRVKCLIPRSGRWTDTHRTSHTLFNTHMEDVPTQ